MNNSPHATVRSLERHLILPHNCACGQIESSHGSRRLFKWIQGSNSKTGLICMEQMQYTPNSADKHTLYIINDYETFKAKEKIHRI